MVMLIYSILLMTINNRVLNGSRRVARMVYQPYGPNMCHELCKNLGYSYIFKKEELSCRRLSCSVEREYAEISFTCLKTDGMTNSSNLPEPQTQNSFDKDLKGHPSLSHNETLLKACEEGNLCMVQYILSKGLADINCRGKWGRTPVMVSARNGTVAVFDYLVTQNCDLLIVDDLTNTLLHVACISGNTDIIIKLLATEKFDVDRKGFYGRTPVMTAARKGFRDVFDLLLTYGCKLKLLDNKQNNLLHLACISGKGDMVKYILSQDIFDIDTQGIFGRTPVMLATVVGCREVFFLLESRGCNMTQVDNENDNILHIACNGGHINLVKYILSKNIFNIDIKGLSGKTPVMMAVWKGYKEVFDLLVSKGCSLREVDDEKNNIFHIACKSGNVDMVEYIQSKDLFDINVRGYRGKTPVLYAAKEGHRKVYDFLVAKGCNLKLGDNYHNNILHLACEGGKVDMVKKILSQDIFDIDSRGYQGRTPAMTAARNGHRAVLTLLINRGCNLIVTDKKQNNIFHVACIGGHVGIVKYLLTIHKLRVQYKQRVPLKCRDI